MSCIFIRAVTAFPSEIDAELAEALGRLIGWSRVRVYDFLSKRAGIQIDVSSILLLASLARLGPVRTSDLAGHMGLDPSTVSRHVARAIDRGWVEKSVDDQDGRAALVSLTRSGRTVRQRLWNEWREMLHEAIQGWSISDREQLATLVLRFHESLVRISEGS